MGPGPNDQGLSRKHILEAIDASLRRLNTDYIDLYLMHAFDAETPIDETFRVLDDMQRAGKVRYVGASNYPAWRLVEALWSADVHRTVRFDLLEPHYNLVLREEFERDLKTICEQYQIGVTPYSPLANGFLTGKYSRNETPESARAGSVLKRYNNDYSLENTRGRSTHCKRNRQYSFSSVSCMVTCPTSYHSANYWRQLGRAITTKSCSA